MTPTSSEIKKWIDDAKRQTQKDQKEAHSANQREASALQCWNDLAHRIPAVNNL